MKRLLLVLPFTLFAFVGSSQPWTYTFGTGNSTKTSVSYETAFMPTPPIGTAFASINDGSSGGSINIDNPGLAGFGSGSEVRMVAPTSTGNPSKFGVRGIPFPTSLVYGRFTFRVGESDGTDGLTNTNDRFEFFMGDGTQSSFTGSGIFSGSQMVTGLEFRVRNSTQLDFNYRALGGWQSVTTMPQLNQGQTYVVDVLCNNSSTLTSNYTYDGVSSTVAPLRIDVYVDGILVLDDVTRSTTGGGTPIGNDVTLSAWMFYSIASTNSANLFVDNVIFSNNIPANIESPCSAEPTSQPTLAGVSTSSSTVDLSWDTGTGGDGYFIVADQGTSPTFTPSDGTDYSISANSDYTAAPLQVGGRIMFSNIAANGRELTITGLSPSTSYTFRIYKFCQTSGFDYLATQPAFAEITINTLAFDPITVVGWTFPAGTSADQTNNLGEPINTGANARQITSPAAGGSLTLAYGAAGASTSALSVSGWSGTSNYVQVAFVTTGFWSNTLSIKFAAADANAPRDLVIEESINGSAWIPLALASTTVPNSAVDFTSGAIANVVLTPSRFSNSAALRFIRIRPSSTFSVDGVDDGDISGTLLIDDLLVESRPIYYRTRATLGAPADIADASNWEIAANPVGPYSNATQDLLSNSEVFATIRSGATLSTVNLNFGNSSARQVGALVVEGGATLDINSPFTINSSLSLGATATITNSSFDQINVTAGATFETANTNGVDGGVTTPGFDITFETTGNGVSFVFSGASAQVTGTSMPTNIDSLTINNPAGVTLSAATTVNGTLALSNGALDLNGGTLTVANSATGAISGGSASSYLTNGTLRRSTNSIAAYAFPMGNAGTYRPVTITPQSTAATAYTVEFREENTTNAGYQTGTEFLAPPLQSVSDFEYYNITRPSGTADATLTLTYGPGTYNGANIGTPANLRVARYNSTLWTQQGVGSVSGDDVSGTVSSGVVSAFSPFAIGSTDPADITTLPVELLSFTGQRTDFGVELFWNTATELNNDRFEIERATAADFASYTTVATVVGAGTTQSSQEYTFLDTEAPADQTLYYRLRQVDYDGTANLSSAIEIRANGTVGTQQWSLYPNPSTGTEVDLVALGQRLPADAQVSLQLTTATGTQLLVATGPFAQARQQLLTALRAAPAGVYIVTLQRGTAQQVIRHVRY